MQFQQAVHSAASPKLSEHVTPVPTGERCWESAGFIVMQPIRNLWLDNPPTLQVHTLSQRGFTA